MTEVDLLISPLCDCVVESTHTLKVSQGVKDKLLAHFGPVLGAFHVDQMERQRQCDVVETVHAIKHTCPEHAAITDPKALYDEIVVHEGPTWPSPCGCRLHLSIDGRTREFTPREHPIKTVRCDIHAHLTDTEQHFYEVQNYYIRNNPEFVDVIASTAEAHGVKPEELFITTEAVGGSIRVEHPTLDSKVLTATIRDHIDQRAQAIQAAQAQLAVDFQTFLNSKAALDASGQPAPVVTPKIDG